MKILFTTCEFWPGVVTALSNIRLLINKAYPEIETYFLKITDPRMGFGPVKMVKEQKYDVIILGGFDDNIKLLAMNASPRAKKVVMWCSPIVQSEISEEISRLLEVLNLANSGVLDYIGIPVGTDASALKNINSKVIHLPIYMNVDELLKHKTSFVKNNKFNISMFSAPNPRKNIIAQMLAIAPFKDKINLHVNFALNPNNRFYLEYGRMLFGSSFINHQWMDREGYLKKIQEMDLCMQVSLSESFNYVGAEHMAFGIPVIVSKSIPFSVDMENFGLVVSDHQNIEEIRSKVSNVMSMDNKNKISGICNQIIRHYCDKSKEKLAESIDNIIRSVGK
jgi:glycosyltransferase involved in cell wall biosynthesis